jgi:hypothetical protein
VPIERAWLAELPRIPVRPAWRSDARQSFFFEQVRVADDLTVRSLYWTLRIAEEEEQWATLVQALPGYQWAQIGFLAASENSPLFLDAGSRFGLLVYCDNPDAGTALLNQRIEIEGNAFPIGVVAGWFEPHVRVTYPYSGCVVGYARSRLSRQVKQGWLTAGHVVPSNQQIGFSDGGVGRVVDRGATCVDAAVVSTSRPPLAFRPARVAGSLTAGDAVRLHDQRGRVVQMNIQTVDPALGTTASRHLPLRFGMDRHGKPGDSGALIDAPANGTIAGLYLGRYLDYKGSGTALGIGLAAHYLTAVMDMEISR